MCTFPHSTYSATGIKGETNAWMQTNICLLLNDDSAINQKHWWVEPDRAQAAGTSVHSSCSMQTVKRAHIDCNQVLETTIIKARDRLHRKYFYPYVNANNKYNQYTVFFLLQF
jgi:hypothetical protein